MLYLPQSVGWLVGWLVKSYWMVFNGTWKEDGDEARMNPLYVGVHPGILRVLSLIRGMNTTEHYSRDSNMFDFWSGRNMISNFNYI